VGIELWDLAADERSVWATDYFADSLAHLDLASGKVSVIRGLPAGPSALTLAYGSVWVACSKDGAVARIDPVHDRGSAVVRLGERFVRPLPIVAALGQVWTRLENGSRLVGIDPATNQVARTIPVGFFYGNDGLDRMGVDGSALWVSGLQIQRVDLQSGAVAKIGQTGIAVDFGAGSLWAIDIGGPLYRLRVPR
jgi:streptogramin lyase